jgi:hypothetical protein
VERFWSKVDVREPDECWEWKAGRDRDGYGLFQLKRRQIRAHRFAWELANGSLLGQLHALHSCDNPSCCNPTHLFPGTNTENTADMVAKGRNAKGANHGRYTKPERSARGSQSPLAKLNEWQVIGIMAQWLQGTQQKQIAERYGLFPLTVGLIVRGKTWRHLFQE